MQRASETIGALAGALAKAQTQLVNPEKSLVATIREDGPRGREQTFRYAPLSSGLEIVRKVLGQQEIATVQTTSIDQAAGLVNLHNGPGPRLRRVDRVRLAGMPCCRYGVAASYGGCTDLCATVCAVRARRDCRGR